jgi:hypothetical protein
VEKVRRNKQTKACLVFGAFYYKAIKGNVKLKLLHQQTQRYATRLFGKS